MTKEDEDEEEEDEEEEPEEKWLCGSCSCSDGKRV